MSEPRLARLSTIAEVARRTFRPVRSMRRLLIALHRTTRSNGGREWMFRAGRGKWYVNESILRSEHPSVYERRFVRRDEFEEQSATIAAMQADLAETKTKLRTLAARERERTERERRGAEMAAPARKFASG